MPLPVGSGHNWHIQASDNRVVRRPWPAKGYTLCLAEPLPSRRMDGR